MQSINGAISSVLAAKQSATQSQIGFAVASKQLDAMRQQGDAANELLQSAAQLGKAIGRGHSFDAIA